MMSPSAANNVRSSFSSSQNPNTNLVNNPFSSNSEFVSSAFGSILDANSSRERVCSSNDGPASSKTGLDSSRRSRPRFVKVRRRLNNARLGEAASEDKNFDLNPFCSVNFVNDHVKLSDVTNLHRSSDSFSVAGIDMGGTFCENIGFVFGANRGSECDGKSRVNLDEVNTNKVKLSCNVKGCYTDEKNGNGVFNTCEVDQSGSTSNGVNNVISNGGSQCCFGGAPEVKGNVNSGFVFGSSSMNMEKERLCELFKKLDFDDNGKVKVESLSKQPKEINATLGVCTGRLTTNSSDGFNFGGGVDNGVFVFKSRKENTSYTSKNENHEEAGCTANRENIGRRSSNVETQSCNTGVDGIIRNSSHDSSVKMLSDDMKKLNSSDTAENGYGCSSGCGNPAGESAGFSSKPFIFQAGSTKNSYSFHCSEHQDNVGADVGRGDRTSEFCFRSGIDGSGASNPASGIPNWDSSCLKNNLFPKSMRNNCSGESKLTGERSFKKRWGKSKRHSIGKVHPGKCFQPSESSPQEISNTPNAYSPMNFSPCCETATDDLISTKVSSVTMNNSVGPTSNPLSFEPCSTTSKDGPEGPVASRGKVHNCESNSNAEDQNASRAGASCVDSCFVNANCSDRATVASGRTDSCASQNQYAFSSHMGKTDKEEFVFSASYVKSSSSRKIRQNRMKSSTKTSVDSFFIPPSPNFKDGSFSFDFSTSSGPSLRPDLRGQEGDTAFPERDSNIDEEYFAFSASSIKSSSSRKVRRYRMRSSTKTNGDSFVIPPSLNFKDGSFSFDSSSSSGPSLPSDMRVQQGNTAYPDKDGNIDKAGGCGNQQKQKTSAAVQEDCEKWRLRGNQAYKSGNFSKAEKFYTKGIESSSNDTSGCSVKPLLLCYSNRAATLMSLGRIREALDDCIKAAALDANFLKVQMRAANCHLVLGEVEHALGYFRRCLESGAEICLDRRLIIEAAEGVQLANKVAEYASLSAKLLGEKTPDAVSKALKVILDAISISKFSEKLLQMKAEALHMLRRHEEVIQLCEQSVVIAEKNFQAIGACSHSGNSDDSKCEISLFRLWRWYMMARSHFCLGRLEKALDFLGKVEQAGLTNNRDQINIVELSISLSVTTRKLLQCKSLGNEAFQQKKYAEAVEHYSTALASNVESRPFAAVCFCNRAAAHQTLGQLADAIADCSLAIALDGYYVKALSRRATLHEAIRDYGQAACDIQKLITILENQSRDGDDELRKAYKRKSSMEEEAKKGITLDCYLILGVKQSDTASDIKKAYRKAALRHHPDKAGQFLVRTDGGYEGQLWKEISKEVHDDADRLFKVIGEAYAVLSDPSKRSQYDLEEEESRKTRKQSSSYSSYRSSPDVYSSPFESSTYRRYRQGNWKTYGN